MGVVRGWVGLWVGALVATSLAVASPSAATKPLVTVDESAVWISPNGDGRQDKAVVHFRLAGAASVVVVVRGDGREKASSLGRLDAGAHRWTWNGRLGGRVRDGHYTVLVRARRDARTDAATLQAVVDTTRPEGSLIASRPTVYPKATAVVDHALVTYLRAGWSAQAEADGQLGQPLRVTFSVVAPDGRAVQRTALQSVGPATLDWYGRGAGGEPLAEGRYDVRVRVLDRAGNLTRLTRPLDVSHRQLRKEAVTTTLAAAAATRWGPAFPGSCLGCGEWCSPEPSPRYVGGLSFTTSCGWAQSLAWFVSPVSFDVAPVDAYRISAAGGPTTPGDAGSVSISGYATVGPGDDSATTPWLPVDLEREPYLADQSRVATWSVSSGLGTTSYDLASFTIEYRHWVPVEG